MSTWQARSVEALAGITAVIHDAYLDSGGIAHDAAAGTLVVRFAQDWTQLAGDDAPEWRGAPRTELLKRTWRYEEQRVPFMRGALTVRRVVALAARGSIGDAGMLTSLDYDERARRLTIEGGSGSLRATVTELDVTAELSHDEVVLHVRRRHGRLLGVETETPLDREP